MRILKTLRRRKWKMLRNLRRNKIISNSRSMRRNSFKILLRNDYMINIEGDPLSTLSLALKFE